MRVEFHQGVPEGCIEWLYENVGKGNTTGLVDNYDYAWFYESVWIENLGPDSGDGTSVPTITVKDEKKAMCFALRWTSVHTITVKDPKLATWFALRCSS